MDDYIINTVHAEGQEDRYIIYSEKESAFFAGYDPMGSVNWEKLPTKECELTKEDDPEQIVEDLRAADDPYPDYPIEDKRINVGYEIIQSIRLDARHEIVIGRHPTAPASYVCWDCTNDIDYNNGGYTSTYRQALLVLSERLRDRYEFLPVEYKN